MFRSLDPIDLALAAPVIAHPQLAILVAAPGPDLGIPEIWIWEWSPPPLIIQWIGLRENLQETMGFYH